MNEFKLEDLLEIKNGRDYKHLSEGNIPVYGSGGLMRYVNESLYNGESILLPRKGTLTNIQYVDEPFWTVDTIYYSIIDKTIAEPYYLFNYLRQLDLSHLNSGTGVPSMTFGAYYEVPIKLPNLLTQKKIAKVLSDLDAKIELNNKINTELEAMAKLLYDYWFVQFDFPISAAEAASMGKPELEGKPYKSSGGEMVYNEVLKREIPEGWGVKTLLDIANFTNGLACQKFRPKDGESSYKVIKIREMGNGFTEKSEFVTQDIPEKIIVRNGDILFSWSATLDVQIWTGGIGGLNQHIFKVTSEKHPRSYYYFELLNYLQHFKMMAELRKTTMGHITQEHLKQSRIVVPSKELIDKLHHKIDPILSKIVKSKEENQQLSELRDWLLPMLMNGQVTVGGKGYEVNEESGMSMAAEGEGGYK